MGMYTMPSKAHPWLNFAPSESVTSYLYLKGQHPLICSYFMPFSIFCHRYPVNVSPHLAAGIARVKVMGSRQIMFYGRALNLTDPHYFMKARLLR